ncbi:MAG: hypothetical protein ACOCWM_01055 [Cyclobacteriaceae bacterium]
MASTLIDTDNKLNVQFEPRVKQLLIDYAKKHGPISLSNAAHIYVRVADKLLKNDPVKFYELLNSK